MRVRVALGPGHEKELQRLMEKWNLDLNSTVGRIISEAVRREKQEDRGEARRLRRAAPGDLDGG